MTTSNKKTKTLYWIFTGLFAAFMLFSAIPDIMVLPDAVKFMHDDLGYPVYLISFIGVAKALGVIAILVPGYPIIKEWAYAGFVFDLVGATYSALMVMPDISILFMLLPFTLLVLSYVYYHKTAKTTV